MVCGIKHTSTSSSSTSIKRRSRSMSNKLVNGNAKESSSKNASDYSLSNTRANHQEAEETAYSILLSCRTSDPIGDSQRLKPDELPSHWVPTMVSAMSRAKSTALGRIDSQDSKPSKSSRKVISANDQTKAENHLPRLTFQNPWKESFRKPSLKDFLGGGLKWGLPDSYHEGDGKSGIMRSAVQANKKIRRQMESAEREGLPSDWDHIQVKDPDWGWDRKLEKEVQHLRHEDQDAKRQTEASQRNGHAVDAHSSHGQAANRGSSVHSHKLTPSMEESKKKGFYEWRDPTHGDVDAARATWLGHATTLLQLPPLVPNLEDAESDLAKPTDTMVEDAPDSSRSSSSSNDNHESSGKPNSSAQKAGSDQQKREKVGHRSINILFDPVFSERCSPSQSAGPQRFTPSPCQVKDLPPIDIVCISHSHYDHLDYLTMRDLRRIRGKKIHAFVGLGVKNQLIDFGWDPEQVSEMDWWDGAVLQQRQPSSWHNVDGNTANATADHQIVGTSTRDDRHQSMESVVAQIKDHEAKLRIICTPAQHGSGRGAGDNDCSLWASWVVEWISPNATDDTTRAQSSTVTESRPTKPNNPVVTAPMNATFRAFFAGDTGLKYHHDNPNKRHKYPPCPAFADIAAKLGQPDLLLLPISVGSSLSYFRSWDPFPRAFSPFPRVSSALTSSIHMDPYDAVECHQLMRTSGGGGRNTQDEKSPPHHANNLRLPVSLAVHYATFVRNESQTSADVRDLRQACKKFKVSFRRTQNGQFDWDDIGKNSSLEDKQNGAFLVSHQGETVWVPFVWTAKSDQVSQ